MISRLIGSQGHAAYLMVYNRRWLYLSPRLYMRLNILLGFFETLRDYIGVTDHT